MSNAATLRSIFELMDQHRNDTIRGMLAPGCVAILGGNPPMDADAWLGMSTAFYDAFPDGRHQIEEVFDVGSDRVVLRGTFEGTHRQPFMGIAATGRRVRITFMNLDRFSGGRLAEHRAEVDMMGPMQQIGAVPA